MKRPLLLVSVAYTAGVVLARYLALPLAGLFAVAFVLALAALVWDRARPWLLWPLLLLTGWVNLNAWMAAISPHDLRRLVGEQIEIVTLRGRLDVTPSPRILIRDEEEKWSTLAVVEAESIQRQGRWQAASGLVAVNTPGVLTLDFHAGRRVEVNGVIRPPKGAVAEGLFDYRAYLQWLGIYHQLQVRDTNDWRVADLPSARVRLPLADRFLNWAQATLGRGLPVEDEPLRLLWAMTLGWKTALTDEVSEPFMQTGTMHIFAISGLHIALIAGILVALLRVLQVPRGACGWVVIPLIWFYTGATGWQSSAIRSTIMMSVVILGWGLRRPTDLVNSLAGSALIILIWQPQQLFQASFQLSFFVVLSIGLLLPPIERMIDLLWKPDPMLPEELVPEWRRRLERTTRPLLEALALSLAAWLGSLPLIAWYFHLATPISLLANLVIVPLSSLALMSNLGGLACGGWLPLVGEWFNHAGWLFMAAMVWISEWAGALPGAFFYVAAPTLAGICLYYTGLVGLLSGWLLAPLRRRWALGGFALLLLVWSGHWYLSRNMTQITVLALNGGSALFIDAPGASNDLLIDCGSAASGEIVVKPFVQAQGVNRLPRLVLTHGDGRHVGGARLVAGTFKAAQVCTGFARSRSPAYRSFQEDLGRTPERWRRLQAGDHVAGWRVLHPSALPKSARADDNALVLLGDLEGVRVLLVSDLGKAGQAELLRSGQDLRADLVVTGLPAGEQPLGDELLAAVRPRLIIVNDATYPANERATRELRERLARQPASCLYTSDCGSVTLRTQAGRWEVRSMKVQT